MPIDTPVTTPAVETVAVVDTLLHDPSVAVSPKVTDDPTQTIFGPLITPVSGNGFIDITRVATDVLQPVTAVNSTVSTPADKAENSPVESIVASPFVTLHAPAVAVSVRNAKLPAHTSEGPTIKPEWAGAEIVSVKFVSANPHILDTT
jgi:hypothetical protein